MTKEKQVAMITSILKKEYPVARTALNYTSPFELLVATILSAQVTDVHVNKVTRTLFKKYRTIQDYADAPLMSLQKDISTINFYKNKAKNIQGAAKIIVDRFGGQVPATMEELISLPGVARKTGNIILYNAFGLNVGIAVDTHVKRLAKRLGLTSHDDPVKIERDLMQVVPQKGWGLLSHLLIFHGRNICKAKKPDHGSCVLLEICPSRDI